VKWLPLLVAGLLIAQAGAAFANPKQPSQPAAKQPGAAAGKQDSERIQRIWNSMRNRTTVQLDAWFEDGDYPRVIKLLRMLYELNPSDYDLATDLGFMLENVEAFDEALAVYVRFRRENPNLADSAFPEAFFYNKRRAYAKIPPLLEPKLKQKPHPNNYRILATAYERLDLLADSARVWKLYISLHPNDDQARANLRRVEDKMKPAG
jgi:tetratricopeptide (TPR) repeat protein